MSFIVKYFYEKVLEILKKASGQKLPLGGSWTCNSYPVLKDDMNDYNKAVRNKAKIFKVD